MRGLSLIVVVAAAVLLLFAAAPSGAAGSDPEPGTPGWYARAAGDYAHAEGRGVDQLANPDYGLRFSPLFEEWVQDQGDVDKTARVNTDPFLLDWPAKRGSRVEVSYENRYGATIRGHLWAPALPFEDPVTGVTTEGPLPAVVVMPGYATHVSNYWGVAQGLAEAGYVVLSFDPQGQGRSDARPSPESDYCGPGGDWREPQELGLTEKGECAGVDPPPPTPDDPLAASPLGFPLQLAEWQTSGPDYTEIAAGSTIFRARYVLGTLDAVDWLLSADNPKRALVDETRVGIAGHSAGSHAAALAANGDPARRFAAAVAWDDFSGWPAESNPWPPEPAERLELTPQVPTMFQHSEQQALIGPFKSQPARQPGSHVAEIFRTAGVDTALVTLRGSTHQEWAYIPYQAINTFGGAPFVNASRKGERVGLYYTQAWFDRYLKGLPTAHVRGDESAQREDAVRRLVASEFDDSVDRSSIGQGSFDALEGRNKPYEIDDEAVREHLSFFLESSYAFDGLQCADARAGC